MHWTEVANRSSARLARISSRGGRRHARRSSYLHGSGRGPCKYENRLSIRAPGEEEMRARNRALHSTRRRRVPPGAAQMDCRGLLALCARSLVEHAGWASCLDATTDLKHLADDCSSLGKAIGSHCGDGAARRRWLQIDLHRTGMRSAIVLSIAAHRAPAGLHARRHQRGQERR